MNELTVFNFNGQNQVRTIIDSEGTPLFCGKDVCQILGYKDTINAIKQHCKGVVFHHPPSDSRRYAGSAFSHRA